MKTLKNQKGFTLIELLVVIGILAILLAITLIAINPAKQFAQANNTQRSNDVNTILNAINQYMADHKGSLPTALESTVCESTAPCVITNDAAIATPKVDLCSDMVSSYIAALPGDPKNGTGTPLNQAACTAGTTYNTRYTVYVGSNNRITVAATDAEPIDGVTPLILVTR